MTTRPEVPPAERCEWRKANGRQCWQRRIEPYTEHRFCRWHEESALWRAQFFRRADDVPDLSVEDHLKLQLKMAWVMVRELEFQVLDLGLALDAWSIKTKEVETREGDDPKNSYVSSKVARLHGAHPVVVQYLKEREVYHNVIKTCVSAGLAAKQVAIVERYVESLISSQMSLAEALGHDPNDPGVRAAIMDTVRRQQMELNDLMPDDPRKEIA